MATPSHFASVFKSVREAQARRHSATVSQDEIAPDDYPTFTRPLSPQLDESKRYTHDPPKRKRTNPWSFQRNPNAPESGDDCDRPLSRRLSRKASNVFHKFTPQTTHGNASTAPAQEFPGAPEEHAAKRLHVTAEQPERRSSLQKLKDYILDKVRKDSATSTKPLLPAHPLDEDDHAMGLWQCSPPKHSQSLYTADPDIIYMTGALPANDPSRNSQEHSENISLDPSVNPILTESRRRKASTAAASIDSADVPFSQGVAVNITGYSPPPTPKNRPSYHYPKISISNSSTCHNYPRRPRAGPSSSGKYINIAVAGSSARHVVAPWEEIEQASPSTSTSTSTSTIGVLPSLSSVESASHVSLPTFALPSTPTNASTIALHTPSRPQSPTQGTQSMDVRTPESCDSSRNSPSPAAKFLDVPRIDTRPSTAADSVAEQELRLRRLGSLRSEASVLEGMEGMEGFEFVERAVGWMGEEEEERGRGWRKRRW
ncbi:hypothetical protein P171DRAFT_59729 [Karstenula rhodostoma CBS 690.94]|uniref:Uncharacterized protein n=1 Tax=Karstenula rhodostoma CBS 690.94 TaxID=1392251 RepID=A0A9P4U9B1_9PLEO|nr:hypothetical protein P171DRAFT_59729 [Karstenula rhodostoma CBS 690.94]